MSRSPEPGRLPESENNELKICCRWRLRMAATMTQRRRRLSPAKMRTCRRPVSRRQHRGSRLPIAADENRCALREDVRQQGVGLRAPDEAAQLALSHDALLCVDPPPRRRRKNPGLRPHSSSWTRWPDDHSSRKTASGPGSRQRPGATERSSMRALARPWSILSSATALSTRRRQLPSTQSLCFNVKTLLAHSVPTPPPGGVETR